MSKNSGIKVAVAADFLWSFSEIPRKQQGKVLEFINKFRENPTSPGINYEKIKTARDPHLRSVRIDQTYRGIVLKPESGNVFVLLWVGLHDAAYAWAEKRICNIHPETGSLQVIETTVLQTPAPEATVPSAPEGLFAHVRDRHLLALGVPELLLPLVRSLETEEDLDGAAGQLPGEAFDALVLLAAGYSLEETMAELEKTAAPQAVDTGDFDAALDNLDSRRRFYVVEDDLELMEILNAPLEQWRVFLHPSQRKLVERDWNGPVRVLGGAGTGKTVVALHRAKWLAQQRCNTNGRVLFTTFTRNLAADIQDNLHKICTSDVMKRIEVMNLDRWVVEFLRKNGYAYEIDYGKRTEPLWRKALTLAPPELSLEPSFYREEWERVIQPWGIASFADYSKASRTGRGVRLHRRERRLIWPVFEEYRLLLDEQGLREPDDAMRDARQLLVQQGNVPPYTGVVVDEAQDMGAQAFQLLRALIPEQRSNDLFIVGDAHQRIYRHKVVLGRCGINIRGRSRKLLINYRTTEENRRWAVSLLEGVSVDDLDGGVDDHKAYKSLMHGAEPRILHFATFEEEIDWIAGYLEGKAQGEDLTAICLVARTHHLLEQYQAALAGRDIKTSQIHRNQPDDRRTGGVRLATMHRVKGLEFERMIIAGVNEGTVPLDLALEKTSDPVIRRETESQERALLYVAATRAKREVIVTSAGKSSRFLTGLQ